MNAPWNRAELAADPQLGTGNVLTALIERGKGLDDPALTFDTEVDGHPAWQALSLRQLGERVAARSAALHALGVKPRDPVAVYVTDAADQVLSFLALARLGAIGALINGAMPGGTAARYVRVRFGDDTPVLVDQAHRELLLEHGLKAELLLDVKELGKGDAAAAPAPFRYHPDDPAVITHSSGTTGLSKAVGHSHRSLFASIKHRLSLPKPQGMERILSALPSAHAATVIAVNLALASHIELALISAPHGPVVLDAIEQWRPESILGFAAVWSELAGTDLTARDLSSVRAWWNTGDCAHEAHVRRLVAVGSRDVLENRKKVKRTGSIFLDGLGSSEMGHSQFFITHTPDSNRYGRCIGKPHAFSDCAVLDENGDKLPVGKVGQLGINAPTLSIGYWNDSTTTYRTRVGGYFLTGDLVYRDEAGYFYHVDRMVDSVQLDDGSWLYTAATEEKVLATCPEVLECTVVAVPAEAGEPASATLLLVPAPGAELGEEQRAQALAALEPNVRAAIREVLAIDSAVLPLGPTGKVRKVALRELYRSGELAALIAGSEVSA
ncbi:class I adenylate-forming enzyme family protein [Kitasatospora viridis]|uniref:Acyl-CoA synthetase (AMP-forming)/AMP-acid ligase II n=1 Tax=Kitasatospora viridis TaxID=281105 RepID=A0A561UIU2_9ACTN|nr:fatty acid--CoA ligase family protein [Kitasatospora viridis]TWF99260.1 acyl-CoA synthetase (AMP-forming)/AMP-acid ligase II [Kitasatospora viridis]